MNKFRRPLLGSSTFYNNELGNSWDVVYTASVFLGTPEQELNVIWDTGSSTLMIESDNCSASTCINTVFETADSSTFVGESATKTLTYTSGEVLTGNEATDVVCAATGGNACTSSGFGFVALT